MNRSKMSTPTRKGGTSALLQKANAQLRGQRVQASPEDKDEDDIGAYLSSLNKKTQKQPQWDKFGEVSDLDISIASNEGEHDKTPAASKFLKKKMPVPENNNVGMKENKFVKKPATSNATPTASKGPGPAKSNASSALSKAAQFMSKFSYEKKKESVVLSDSDLDMDLSMDSDVMADVQAMKTKPSVNDSQSKSESIQKRPITTVSKPTPAFSFKPSNSQSSPDNRRSGSADDRKRNSSDVKKRSSPVDEKKKTGKSKNVYGYDLSESSTSEAIGKGGSKFIKKKTAGKSKTPSPEPVRSPSPPKRDQFRLKSSDKYATQVMLDTDEESLADFIGGLSSSSGPQSARTPRGRVSPRQTSPKFARRKSPVPTKSPEPYFGSIKEVDEIVSDDVSIEEESFKMNIMGIDALATVFDLEPAESPRKHETKKSKSKSKSKPPSSPKQNKQKTPRKDEKKRGKENKEPGEASPFFSNMGLHTVDELFGSDAEISEASEVPSEEPEVRSPTPLRSILSPTPRSQTPRRVRLSLSEIREIRSRSPSPEPISTARAISSKIYTEDFEDIDEKTDHSESAASIHTSDSEESIRTLTDTGRNSPSRARKRSIRGDKSNDDYSDDFTETSAASKWKSYSSRSSSRESGTYSDDYTSYGTSGRSRTPSPESRRSRPVKKDMKSVEIQTGEIPGLWYHWNQDPTLGGARMSQPLGLHHVDPTPIASHVVSADALEALTSYSPSVIALNDMLRLQLQITQQFVETQKRMHQAYIGSSIPDHSYTTLAETKKYISKHRKPKLTFEEALKQVKKEMELE